MAGTETLLDAFKGMTALAPAGQGFADRSAARANADIYRQQAREIAASTAQDETNARREGRAVIASQAARVIAEGGGDSSQMDVVRQNEVNLIADALAIRRRGQVAAAGFESRARASEYEGDQALYGGIASAGSGLLMTAAERRARTMELEKLQTRRRSKAGVN